MSINIHEYIFWFDISIDHVLAVEILQSHHDLAEVEPSCFFWELTQFVQMKEDFSASAQIHHEEQFFRLYKINLNYELLIGTPSGV